MSQPAATVSVIVPTFREAKNLPELITRISAALSGKFPYEVIIVDDNSRDGTAEAISGMGNSAVRLIVRETERGLSSAVLRGLNEARHNTLVCMDADLSHPPEVIPTMLDRLNAGADFVLGSRYVPGGGTEADWGLFRALNSRVATLLARPFTNVKDPMSGYFALRRETFAAAQDVNPIGYKIGLELIVKCRCKRVEETPIRFANRTRGESKLSLKEQLRYLRHLGRLSVYKLTGRRSTASDGKN